MSICYVPGIVLGAGDAVVNKAERGLVPKKLKTW